jgi:hypothetical protein
MTEATPRPLTGTWWQDPNDNRIHDAAGNDVLDYLPVTEIGKRVNAHDALVAALEAVEWAVPTPDADNDGSCPLCYAGKPVWNSAIIHKHYVIPYVFDRKNHMKVCQLADALEAAE